MNWFALFQPFLELSILRTRPQDLPVSRVLLGLTATVFALVGLFANFMWLALPLAFVATLVEATILVVFVTLVLRYMAHPERTGQTLTAMFGYSAVLGFAAADFRLAGFGAGCKSPDGNPPVCHPGGTRVGHRDSRTHLQTCVRVHNGGRACYLVGLLLREPGRRAVPHSLADLTGAGRTVVHIHILGICGTFMGGIARLAIEADHTVSGVDRVAYPPMSDQLAALGIHVEMGFDQPLPDADLVVVGNSMTRGMPVIEELLRTGRPYVSGPEWLRHHILHGRHVIAVAGTNGKTTQPPYSRDTCASRQGPGFPGWRRPRQFQRLRAYGNGSLCRRGR